jgi:hypothetical protein
MYLRKLAVAGMLAACVLPGALEAREFTVVTYNVENLFDADGVSAFADYAETGEPHSYSPAHLLEKLRAIGRVLKTFNGGAGPEVVCFNEFEIDFSPESGVGDMAAFLEKYRGTTVARMLGEELDDTIRGLPVEALLLKHLEDEGMTGYHVVTGADEADTAALGLDGARVKAHKNALFSKFPVTAVRSHETPQARDILEATLDVEGHPFTIFVNHWKSGASDFNSEQSRRFNAKTLRGRLEEIFRDDPAADVLLAGDFNSHYNQNLVYPYLGKTGVTDILGSGGDEAATAAADGLSLYNLWFELPPKERRSDAYRGQWGTLMHKMVTPGLYDNRGIQYVDNSFKVIALPENTSAAGLPRRWSHAGTGGGASDHFPIKASFRVAGDDASDGRLVPENPGKPDAPSELFPVGLDALSAAEIPPFKAAFAREPGMHAGEIFRVHGVVSSKRPMAVEVLGEKYLLYSFDPDLRKELQKFPKGARIEFLGEFGAHKGSLQFIVQDPSWLLSKPRGGG